MNADARAMAEEKLEILHRGQAFESLLRTPGWKYLFALHTEWVESARKDLRRVDTQDVTKALDALQRWQLAENLMDLEAGYINSTLEQAKEILGTRTFDDALLMEQVEHEQQRSDPAGY